MHVLPDLLSLGQSRGVFRDGTAVYITPHERHMASIGAADEHRLFDVASVTKSVITTTVVYRCCEQHLMTPTMTVRDILPHAAPHMSAITVRHLLDNTSGLFMTMSALADLAPPEIVTACLEAPLVSPPGERYYYQNINSFLLARMVEKVTGLPLDELAQRWIFDPLAMRDATFHVPPSQRQRCIPTEVIATSTTLQGVVQDESARALLPTVVSGAAGLFASASDLAAFVQMQLAGPTPITGWEFHAPWMGSWAPTSYGKTGFSGCSITIDTLHQRGLIILTNRTYPQRPAASDTMMKWRQEVHAAIDL